MPDAVGRSLRLIEAWESLRTWMLERDPALATALAERLAVDWRAATARERGVMALVAALDLPTPNPAVRRHARTLLGEFEQQGLLDPPAGERPTAVREDTLPEFGDMTAEVRERIAHDLRAVMAPAFQTGLAAAPGPIDALAHVESGTKTLRGMRAARYLALLGYPMALPEKATLRWLHRFGLVADMPTGKAARLTTLRAMDEFARAVGVTLGEADYFIALLTGSGELAHCKVKPQCNACPMRAQCDHGVYLQKHPHLAREDDGDAGRRTLTESLLPEDRPREKLQNGGAERLTNAELLAILLRTGSDKEHAVEVANRLLRDAGSLERLGRYTISEMTRTPGVGPVKAVTIKAALELARRLGAAPAEAEPAVAHARTVFELLRGHFLERRKEQFVCLLLNTKNRVQRQVIVSEGTLNQSLVHPREAFQDAIRDSAAAVIFAHNHPSGDPAPSRDDKAITRRLVTAGQMLGIRVLDHIIIGRDTYYSFADEGELNGE